MRKCHWIKQERNEIELLWLLWQVVWRNCKLMVCHHEYVMVWWTAGTFQMKPAVATVQIITSTVEQAKSASQWKDVVMGRVTVLMAVMRKDVVSTCWAGCCGSYDLWSVLFKSQKGLTILHKVLHCFLQFV